MTDTLVRSSYCGLAPPVAAGTPTIDLASPHAIAGGRRRSQGRPVLSTITPGVIMPFDRQAEFAYARIRAVRLIAILVVLWVCLHDAHAAVTINEASKTFVIRQGAQQLSSVGLVPCPADQPGCNRDALTIAAGEAELRARVVSPLPTPTRTYQVRTGSGISITSARTLEECRQIPRDRLALEGQTKVSGGNVLTCQMQVRYSSSTMQPFLLVTFNFVATFKPGTTTPPPPVDLPAPTGLAVTVTSERSVRWQWNVVPDALAYLWEFCRGSGCTNFATPVCTDQLSVNHTLALNATARFRVRASRSATCTTGLGAWSVPIQGTTVIQPDPEGPPTACNGLVCRITWQYLGTPQPDEFRFWWARTEATVGVDAINSVLVTDGTARTMVVTLPSGGVWHFGGKSYMGGTASNLSNIIVRTVQ